jgi:hypothetical protein
LGGEGSLIDKKAKYNLLCNDLGFSREESAGGVFVNLKKNDKQQAGEEAKIYKDDSDLLLLLEERGFLNNDVKQKIRSLSIGQVAQLLTSFGINFRNRSNNKTNELTKLKEDFESVLKDAFREAGLHNRLRSGAGSGQPPFLPGAAGTGFGGGGSSAIPSAAMASAAPPAFSHPRTGLAVGASASPAAPPRQPSLPGAVRPGLGGGVSSAMPSAAMASAAPSAPRAGTGLGVGAPSPLAAPPRPPFLPGTVRAGLGGGVSSTNPEAATAAVHQPPLAGAGGGGSGAAASLAPLGKRPRPEDEAGQNPKRPSTSPTPSPASAATNLAPPQPEGRG